MIKSFRLYLTAWYLALFTVLFTLFGLFLYEVLERALYQRLHEKLLSAVNTSSGLFRSEMGEMKGDAAAAAKDAMSEINLGGGLVAVFEGSRLLAASATVNGPELARVAARAAENPSDLAMTVSSNGQHPARALARRLDLEGRRYELVALEPLDSIHSELSLVRRFLYITLPLVVTIAGIGGFVLATRSLAPLRSMAGQARTITDKNLSTRLDIGAAHEELKLLADSFNELLSRLDQSFETMRRFVADASHELRTPLSVIRGEADVALAHERSAGEYKESLAIIQDEARRLSRLVEDLLNLARADAGRVHLRLEEFYVNDLLGECCRSVQAAVSAKRIQLECNSPGDVAFRGDQELLRRLVLNLLDNAIRYTPEGGKVRVRLETGGQDLRIEVADTGIGISPEAAPQVFTRFYRADEARSRQNGGFGLGLSIVKWIAEAHRGTVELRSTPGFGSTFTVVLQR